MSYFDVVSEVYGKLFPLYCNDDLTDQLNHRWTCAILLVLSGVVISQYGDTPIRCWCPAEFTDSHCNYTNLYCWVKDTYFLPTDETIPVDETERNEKEIKYYQWVPVILVTLACLYKLPNLIWKFFTTLSGFNILKAVKYCEESQMSTDRDEEMKNMADVLDSWIQTTRWLTNSKVKMALELFSIFCFCFGKKTGTYLSSLYLFVKLCYIAVSVGLVFLLNMFLAMDYSLYGIEVISKLTGGEHNHESKRFPSTTLCDFEIRQLQNIQRFTVHCILSVNIYNEATFAFLWFWCLILGLLGVLSLIMWMKKVLFPSQRLNYIHKHMEILSKTDDERLDNETERKFARDYLGADGVFVLRMIEYNTNEMVVHDLLKHLWHRWSKKDD